MLLGFDIGGTKCAVVLGRHDNISIKDGRENKIRIIGKIVLKTDRPLKACLKKTP